MQANSNFWKTSPSCCPICESAELSATHRTHEDTAHQYEQWECKGCLVQFWWPLKNPGAEWYAKAGYAERNADPVWNATWNHKKTVFFLRDHKGSVLDVGCGIGNFLAAAKKEGWQCAGIDFDPDAISAAKKVTGIVDLEVADVLDYAHKHPDRRFDLVTFFDVLEHVDNHNEFIAAIKKLLRPGGFLAMSMPYREHALWLMKGDVPPRHLTCWDRESLKRFLEARGFDVVYMRRGAASFWTIVMKLRFKYGSNVSFGAVSAVRKSVGDKPQTPGKRPLAVRAVHTLAKIKDAVLFGVPAALIWVAMIPTAKRYDDLFAIARLRS
jgi:SAM-dependent methyltransferase